MVPVCKVEDQPAQRYSSPDVAAKLSKDDRYSALMMKRSTPLETCERVEPYAHISDDSHWLYDALVYVDGTGL